MSQHLSLPKLLARAAQGDTDATRQFYLELLTAEIFLPLDPRQQHSRSTSFQSSELQTLPYFLTFKEQDRSFLPIFLEKELANNWAENRLPIESRRFANVLALIAEEQWVIINPGSELGKELSPWELQQLRHGAESIDELISELDYLPEVEVSVDQVSAAYEWFKQKAGTILDQYPEIKEAFLIQVATNEPNQADRLFLGLRHDDLTTPREQALHDELQNLAHHSCGLSAGLTIVPDLNQRANPNVSLFNEVNPFYIAGQLNVRGRKSKQRGLLGKLFSWSRRKQGEEK